jgi:hypothetical protein
MDILTKYRLLRRDGYTAQAAIWNARHCSDLFWQRLIGPRNGPEPFTHQIARTQS